MTRGGGKDGREMKMVEESTNIHRIGERRGGVVVHD